MDKTRLNNLIDILGERYAEIENTFTIRNNLELTKYLSVPKDWAKKQLANTHTYKKTLSKMAKDYIGNLNDVSEKIVLLSYRTINEKDVKVTKEGIVASNVPKSVRKQIARIKKENATQLLLLANIGFLTYKASVNSINANTAFVKTPFIKPDKISDMAKRFFNIVKKQMDIGIDKGLMVQYKDGKQMTWKSYMEMNIRTTMHHEVGEEQIEAGTKVGQVFYICDSFADCAEDHAPYQGKLYYNDKVPLTAEIKKFIVSHHILSMQKVRDNKPWLTTRPNCRHNFHAIPLDEAMGNSVDTILKNEKLAKGKYKDSNYQKMQQQRYNERMIRKYKMRKENGDALFAKTGDKRFKPTGKEDMLIREWQKRNKILISNNPTLLKRDYDRENIRLVVNDLGVKYYN